MLRPLLLVSMVSTALSAQAVHVVGPGGFAQIQAAIAAAANGDVVVVHGGTYEPFTLGKDLTITAAPGATVTVTAAFVGNTLLQPPSRAELVGLQFRPTFFPFLPVQVLAGHVSFHDCVLAGVGNPTITTLTVQNATVALQRCRVVGGPIPAAPTATVVGGGAVTVVHGSLAAVDCEFVGGELGWDFSTHGGHALRLDDAAAHLVRCTVLGGGNSAMLSTYPAGNGVHVATNSDVWIADSLVRGGDGHATAGDAAIRNLGNTPVVLARTTLQAGPGAPPGAVTIGPIASGPLLGHGSTIAPLVLGQPWTLDYRAAAGTNVLVVGSDRLALHPITPLLAERAWLAPVNLTVLAFGITDAAGSLQVSLPLPATPALLHTSWFTQGVAGLALPLEVSPPVGGIAR
ncbi:MAG: hypothetical protein JNK15_00105 [Planctomycetes bacterium]|nr:hypothetical protein [Planctomycetota bacterium]